VQFSSFSNKLKKRQLTKENMWLNQNYQEPKFSNNKNQYVTYDVRSKNRENYSSLNHETNSYSNSTQSNNNKYYSYDDDFHSTSSVYSYEDNNDNGNSNNINNINDHNDNRVDYISRSSPSYVSNNNDSDDGDDNHEVEMENTIELKQHNNSIHYRKVIPNKRNNIINNDNAPSQLSQSKNNYRNSYQTYHINNKYTGSHHHNNRNYQSYRNNYNNHFFTKNNQYNNDNSRNCTDDNKFSKKIVTNSDLHSKNDVNNNDNIDSDNNTINNQHNHNNYNDSSTKKNDGSHDFIYKTINRDHNSLNKKQSLKLLNILCNQHEIHDKHQNKDIKISVAFFLLHIVERLNTVSKMKGYKIENILLGGGAAANVVNGNDNDDYLSDIKYNDIDIMIDVDIDDKPECSNENKYEHHNDVFGCFRDVILQSIQYFASLQAFHFNINEISSCYLATQNKMLCCNINNSDNNNNCWSVYSTHHRLGSYVDFVFIHRMKRRFTFSADSFRIQLSQENLKYAVNYIIAKYSSLHLHSVQNNSSIVNENNNETCKNITQVFNANDNDKSVEKEMIANWNELIDRLPYPWHVFSLSNSFERSYYDLKNHRIFVDHPEEIYGGGFLKYCDLLTKGWSLKGNSKVSKNHNCKYYHSPCNFENIENLLCLRFVMDIDVGVAVGVDINQDQQLQQHVVFNDRTLEIYLKRHFKNQPLNKLYFLSIVIQVLSRIQDRNNKSNFYNKDNKHKINQWDYPRHNYDMNLEIEYLLLQLQSLEQLARDEVLGCYQTHYQLNNNQYQSNNNQCQPNNNQCQLNNNQYQSNNNQYQFNNNQHNNDNNGNNNVQNFISPLLSQYLNFVSVPSLTMLNNNNNPNYSCFYQPLMPTSMETALTTIPIMVATMPTDYQLQAFAINNTGSDIANRDLNNNIVHGDNNNVRHMITYDVEQPCSLKNSENIISQSKAALNTKINNTEIRNKPRKPPILNSTLQIRKNGIGNNVLRPPICHNKNIVVDNHDNNTISTSPSPSPLYQCNNYENSENIYSNNDDNDCGSTSSYSHSS